MTRAGRILNTVRHWVHEHLVALQPEWCAACHGIMREHVFVVISEHDGGTAEVCPACFDRMVRQHDWRVIPSQDGKETA